MAIDDKELKSVLAQINKRHSKRTGSEEPIVVLASEGNYEPQFISTGIKELDDLFGGGLPRSAMTALHGSEFVGKTCVGLSVASVLTNQGLNVLYVCTEWPVPHAMMEHLGVDMDHFFVVEPQDYTEQMIDATEAFLFDSEKRKVRKLIDLVIVDSINNFVGKKEIDKLDAEGAEGQNMAVRAKLIDDFLRRIQGRGMLKSGTAVLLIAQDRANMNPMSMIKAVMSGGFSLKYNPKVIAKLTRENLKGDRSHDGHVIKVDMTKNAVTGRRAKTEYTVIYGEGVDDTAMVQQRCEDWGYLVLETRGLYSVLLPDGYVTIKGKGNIPDTLRHPKVRPILKKLLLDGKPKNPPVKVDREISLIEKIVEKTEEEIDD